MNISNAAILTEFGQGNKIQSSASKQILDKSLIPKCNILGVGIAAINMKWLIEYLSENIIDLSGEYIVVSNVHTMVMSYEDPSYCEIQNNAFLAIPDGGPLSTIGRKRGFQHIDRTTGPDLMDEVFKISVENKHTHYFYGSTNETLNSLKITLEEKYPGIIIKGMCSPPFRQLTDEENSEVTININKVSPDFIWVGLGAPKQEKWMAANQGKVNGLMIGVGAGFDYFAGKIRRAPMWMQRNNLEWLYRLLQDPKRLFIRYLRTNPKFLWLIARGK